MWKDNIRQIQRVQIHVRDFYMELIFEDKIIIFN
jgi:hypothetical protein